MILPILSVAIYILNIIFSILISLTIINKLYISKKFSKENNFHFYNDMFSWEMFFFQVSIAYILTIIAILISVNSFFSIIFFKIRIFIFFMAFWGKLIHLEKVMDKITYERHYFAGIIPCIFGVLILIIDMPSIILLIIFIVGSVMPYLIIDFIFKKTNTYKKDNLKVLIGVVFIVIGCVMAPELLVTYIETIDILWLINMISSIFFIIGTFIIFTSFRKPLMK